MSILDKLEKRFYWKELSGDGLLKEPPRRGPYYNDISLNEGFSSEEKALAGLDTYFNHKPYDGEDVYSCVSLVLITVYESK